ncbi:uncharacterized protein SPAPADRAFT_56512 [Spathaspora passalidarum NRRL Y-27907]|uniref:Uncharacterized protein n=1 Tax=Spathaspora passalidarum (strain NRRL Y-27907 / 11-Y1) TaxID=619300 RepID=G3ARB6_SPAPN|nr:uncharacterized protein SPAPADRAFT_56512 [Spathaspora passalidarum NRRL Y-27907]EGW31723.1 hypothetical protein SPAPADRAFT_56512 [Spathaspora passalidarum NRRL Y-27907]
MSNLDTLLNDIITSVKATKSSIDDIKDHLISSLLEKTSTTNVEGVSLLSLKNQALLSYINNIALVVLGQVARLEEVDDVQLWEDSVKRSIVQRVTLEKGIKPLEKKIGYQLDKMVRAYTRMEEDERKIEDKLNKADNSDENSDEDEEDSEEEDDRLAYRPDASALAKLAPKGKDTKPSGDEKYVAPKISAMAPPSAIPKEKPTKTKKLQSMEEYLQEQSEMPTAEASIGSTIVDHGRGGVKTQHDRRKEQEIQTYEESNFIRLPQAQTKKSFKQKQRDMANQFAGEDWAMFNNDRQVSSGTSRKRKPTSVWDRVKKRRN